MLDNQQNYSHLKGEKGKKRRLDWKVTERLNIADGEGECDSIKGAS